MTERRERFVVEYLKCGNATQAAIRAGFSKKTAGAAGARLLKDVSISTSIVAAKAPALEEAQITLVGHLSELERLRELSKKAGQMSAAIAAETNRGKVAGFYVERQEISGNAGGPVRIEVIRRIVRADA